MQHEDLKAACNYISSELSRIETVAGTLAMIEREHYNTLNRFDHRELLDVAVEEQSAARQLGMVKQVCGELVQKMAEIQKAIEQQPQGGAGHAEAH
ncbi:prefoldin subunit 5 [Symbiobacterium terraclitae]|uniref:Prefoldin subunit 5 n=1 Tax=Symbiobacterium terraclitae TaxID=557451 RepID=A0ABS4JVI8_9FIRM|nr:hypothetical protein [Symbiobacterium terraclitae]MBP2019555.1 prefoldin subunit 5 [Symbiobacterium terraclitae]